MSSTTLTISSTPLPSLPPTAPTTASSLDDLLTHFLSTWSPTSTLLLLITLSLLLYPLFFNPDPDTHPFLLARQSTPAPIRQPGESAVYRALDVPHGYPLKASLGVRDQGAPKWSPGRRGDLRDIWRTAVEGPVGEGGEHDRTKVGKVVIVRGTEGVEQLEMEEVTGRINAFGTWIKGKGEQKRVAVCLSNSVEVLVCVFAAAFHDFTAVLLPFNLAPSQTASLLAQSNADILVAEAGTLDLDSLPKTLKEIVLVAKGVGKHMNWEEGSPQGVKVSTWEKVASGGSKEVLPLDKETNVRPLSLFSAVKDGKYELVEFTSENIVAGIAGLTSTVARNNKLGLSDILLPTSPLTDSYTLCWTFAALYANATVALNSVAGDNVDLALCTAGSKPTVIVAAPGTIEKYVKDTTKSGSGPGAIGRYFAGSSLQAGVMPLKRPAVALSSLSKLRLVLIGQPAASRTRLSSSTLHELRLLLGAKVAYGLTVPKVAGAVSQTNLHDYRNKDEYVSVGPPLGSVEVHMFGAEEKLGSSTPEGKLVVRGPSVSGGRAELDVAVQIDTDHTLKLL